MKPDTNRELGGLAKTTGLIVYGCASHIRFALVSAPSVASAQNIAGVSRPSAGSKV